MYIYALSTAQKRAREEKDDFEASQQAQSTPFAQTPLPSWTRTVSLSSKDAKIKVKGLLTTLLNIVTSCERTDVRSSQL